MKGVLESAARDSQMVLEGCSYKNDKKLRRVGDIYVWFVDFDSPGILIYKNTDLRKYVPIFLMYKSTDLSKFIREVYLSHFCWGVQKSILIRNLITRHRQ
jgi:hypothetical protein